MKEKIFYLILILISVIGCIFTGLHVKYVIDMSKDMSITAFISNEE